MSFFRQMFAVNHLGHFYLTLLLLDKLRASAPARVVHVASAVHNIAPPLDIAALWTHCDISGLKGTFQYYGRSKLCNILFSRELSRRLCAMGEAGVTSTALHPGAVNTNIGLEHTNRLVQMLIAPARLFMRSPDSGADTVVYCAASTAPAVAGRSGGYYVDCAEVAPAASALDEAKAAELWDASCDLVSEKVGQDMHWAKDFGAATQGQGDARGRMD